MFEADENDDDVNNLMRPLGCLLEENDRIVPKAKHSGKEWEAKIVSTTFPVAGAQELICQHTMTDRT